MVRLAKGTPTDLNLSTLADHFRGQAEAPNQIAPTSASGLRRCMKAGLLVVSPTGLVLTARGQDALAGLRVKRSLSIATMIAAGKYDSAAHLIGVYAKHFEISAEDAERLTAAIAARKAV